MDGWLFGHKRCLYMKDDFTLAFASVPVDIAVMETVMTRISFGSEISKISMSG